MAENQVITTLGERALLRRMAALTRAATGDKRATLRVVGPQMSVAIYGAYDYTNSLEIRNVQIDGNRPAMGALAGGAALIEIGGVRLRLIVRTDRAELARSHGQECSHPQPARLVLPGASPPRAPC